jgi:hypothetical protein
MKTETKRSTPSRPVLAEAFRAMQSVEKVEADAHKALFSALKNPLGLDPVEIDRRCSALTQANNNLVDMVRLWALHGGRSHRRS